MDLQAYHKPSVPYVFLAFNTKTAVQVWTQKHPFQKVFSIVFKTIVKHLGLGDNRRKKFSEGLSVNTRLKCGTPSHAISF